MQIFIQHASQMNDIHPRTSFNAWQVSRRFPVRISTRSTGCSNCGLSWFSSVSWGGCWDSTLEMEMVVPLFQFHFAWSLCHFVIIIITIIFIIYHLSWVVFKPVSAPSFVVSLLQVVLSLGQHRHAWLGQRCSVLTVCKSYWFVYCWIYDSN